MAVCRRSAAIDVAVAEETEGALRIFVKSPNAEHSFGAVRDKRVLPRCLGDESAALLEQIAFVGKLLGMAVRQDMMVRRGVWTCMERGEGTRHLRSRA